MSSRLERTPSLQGFSAGALLHPDSHYLPNKSPSPALQSPSQQLCLFPSQILPMSSRLERTPSLQGFSADSPRLPSPSTAFSVYVEKELVGKHIKSSKVKVLWQIAFDSEFVVHQVELRHSIVSGKREVLINNSPEYVNKALFQGTFEHRTKLNGHDIRITVEDTFEGYLYDLVVDGVAFHRLPRKTLADLEALRNEKREAAQPPAKMDFAAFTGKSKATLDGAKKKDDNLIELDWDAAVRVQAPQVSTPQHAQHQQQQHQQFNPFDAFQAPQVAQAGGGGYDPFGGAGAAPVYGGPQYDPFATPSTQSQYGGGFPQQAPPPQQPYYSAPPPQQQQQQQQRPYDPFA